MMRIIVFTKNLDHIVRKGILSLLSDSEVEAVLVLVHEPKSSLLDVLRKYAGNTRMHGWRWVSHTLRHSVVRIQAKGRKTPWHSASWPGQVYHLDQLMQNGKLRIHKAENINGPETVSRAGRFKPDIGVSLDAPRLDRNLYDLPRLGSINLHRGKLPDYRSGPPAFWELWNDESEIGCTVHKIGKEPGSGDIVVSRSLDKQKYSTPGGVRVQLDELGIELIHDAIQQLALGTALPVKQPVGNQLHVPPTLKEQERLLRKITPRSAENPLRRALKSIAITTYLNAMRPAARLWNRVATRREVVILLYHRVSDHFRDGVTVGIEQFDRQMSFVAERYPIASIEDVVRGNLPKNTGGKPVVAVTFDDGYLDNFENAVPILLRYGIPAAFFVSTGKIESEEGFDHDLNKLGYAVPTMTWDHLRQMHAMGFTIGSHTVSHINCAQTSDAELQDELTRSKKDLERELALQEIYFAYPFGGREDFSAHALELVKASGYKCCMSAYGGVNVGPLDPFNLLRLGVSAGFEPNRFAARVEGL